MVIKRGDMFYADLSPVVGSEQGGIRPVLIIQNDMGNKYSPTVIAAAITSQMNKTKLPTHIEIDSEQCGLKNNSVVLAEQIRTIDKSRLKEKIGHIEDEKLDFGKLRKQVYNQVRGLNSWPGAYFILEGKRIKVWECYISDNNYSNLMDGQISNIYPDGIGIKVSNGEVVLTVIQPEGKQKMSATAFANGFQNKEDLIGKLCN